MHVHLCFVCAFVFVFCVKHYSNFPSQKINIIKKKVVQGYYLELWVHYCGYKHGLESDLLELESWLYVLLAM